MGVADTVADAAGETVLVCVGERLGLSVGVVDTFGVRVGVRVGETEAVELAVGDDVGVTVVVVVTVTVRVALRVDVGDDVGTGLGEALAEGDGVGGVTAVIARRPTRLSPYSVNQMFPSGPLVMPRGKLVELDKKISVVVPVGVI